ncbi:hypothetical protein [Streptomyces sp. NPDC059134]|uniref:hypothetical protein n=1 Tax=Streptomyces sp. NPDC059134 TaxID=3346738 RepID=UPI0036C4FF07
MTSASETGTPATTRAPESAPAPPVLDGRQRNIVFATIMLGVLLAALDQTIGGAAPPTQR